jgi:hypothetical protein
MSPANATIPCKLTDVHELVTIRYRRLMIGAVAVIYSRHQGIKI